MKRKKKAKEPAKPEKDKDRENKADDEIETKWRAFIEWKAKG